MRPRVDTDGADSSPPAGSSLSCRGSLRASVHVVAVSASSRPTSSSTSVTSEPACDGCRFIPRRLLAARVALQRTWLEGRPWPRGGAQFRVDSDDDDDDDDDVEDPPRENDVTLWIGGAKASA